MALRFVIILILFSACVPKEEENKSTIINKNMSKKVESSYTTPTFSEFLDVTKSNNFDLNTSEELSLKTAEILNDVAKGSSPPIELLTQVSPVSLEEEITFIYAPESNLSTNYIKLSFNLDFQDEMYIPYKKYCLNETGSGFHFCKYNALIDWGESYSIISNNIGEDSYVEKIEIQHSDTSKDITKLSHQYESAGTKTVKVYGIFEGFGSANKASKIFQEKIQEIKIEGSGAIVKDLSYLFHEMIRPGEDFKVPNLSGIINTTSMFENSNLDDLDLASFDLSSTFSMAGMFKNIKAINIIFDANETFNQLKNITNIYYNAKVDDAVTPAAIQNLGKDNHIKYFNSAFNKAVIGDLDLSQWNFSSALSVSEMFFNQSNTITIDANRVKDLELSSRLNNAFSYASSTTLICLNGTPKTPIFNLKCPYEKINTDDYHRWVYEEKANDENWPLPTGSMKLVFMTTEDAQDVTVPIDEDYSIFWGDGKKTTNETSHTYDSPGEYSVTIIAPDTGIAIILSKASDIKWTNHIYEVHALGKIDSPSVSGLFESCTKLKTFNLGSEYTAKTPITDFSSLFSGASSLERADLTNFVTSSATNISSMFKDTKALESIVTEGWNTTEVTNFSSMFENATAIEKLILDKSSTNWDVGNGENFSNMFKNASYLKELNLKYWNIDLSQDITGMLQGLSNLKILNVRGWNDVSSTHLSNMGVASSGDCSTEPNDTCLSNVNIACSTYPASGEFVPQFAGYNCYGPGPMAFKLDLTEEDKEVRLPLSCSAGDGCDYDFTVCFHDTNGTNCSDHQFILSDGTSKYSTDNNVSYTYATAGKKVIVIDGVLEGWGYLGGDDCGDGNTEETSGGVTYLKNITSFNMGDIKFKTMRNAFCGADKLTDENFVSTPGIADTSSLINMYAAFRGTGLKKLDLNHWDTSNLLHMNSAFRDSSGLTSLEISNWNVSKLDALEYAFEGLSNLTTLNLSKWNTDTIEDEGLNGAFYGMSSVTELDLNGFDVLEVDDFSHLFSGCSNLKTLKISNWNFRKDKTLNFAMLFLNTTKLETFLEPTWGSIKINNMNQAFKNTGISSLNLSSWDVSETFDLSSTFEGTTMTSLDLSNWQLTKGSNDVDLNGMFKNSTINDLDVSGWNTSGVDTITSMFEGFKTTDLDLSHFDVRDVDVNFAKRVFYDAQISGTLNISNWNLANLEAMESANWLDYTVLNFFGGENISLNTLIVRNWDNQYEFNMGLDVEERVATFWSQSLFPPNRPNIICSSSKFQFFGNGCTQSSTNTVGPGLRAAPGAGNNALDKVREAAADGEIITADKIGDNHLHPALQGQRIDEIPPDQLYEVEININPPLGPVDPSNLPGNNGPIIIQEDFTVNVQVGAETYPVDFHAGEVLTTKTVDIYHFDETGAGENFDVNVYGQVDSYSFGAETASMITSVGGLSNNGVTDITDTFKGMDNLESVDFGGMNFEGMQYQGAMEGVGAAGMTASFDNVTASDQDVFNNLFEGNSSITSVTGSNLDFSSMRSVDGMFSGVSSLDTASFDGVNMANASGLDGMLRDSSFSSFTMNNATATLATTDTNFQAGADNLTDLTLSNINAPNLTSVDGILNNSLSLTNVDLSGAGTNLSSVTSLNGAADGSLSLSSVNLDGANLSSVTDVTGMTNNLGSSTEVSVLGTDFSSMTAEGFTSVGSSSFLMDNTTSLSTGAVTMDLFTNSFETYNTNYSTNFNFMTP